jgi:SAM-dependent methyltransferase
VTLTDVSAAMVAEATKAVAAAGLENVGCLLMDAQHLEFPDATFDAVIARNVLMFVPRLSAGLAEIRRVLRPGGRLAATVWSAGRRNPRMSIPVLAARALGATVPAEATLRVALRLAPPARLAGALRRAGFSNVGVQRVAATFKLDDAEAVVDQWYQHGPTQEVFSLIPAGSMDRLRAELERRLQPYARTGILPGEQLVFGGTA